VKCLGARAPRTTASLPTSHSQRGERGEPEVRRHATRLARACMSRPPLTCLRVSAVASVAMAIPVGQPGVLTAATVAAGVPPGMQPTTQVPVSGGLPLASAAMVAAGGVPISVPQMAMPTMPAVNVGPGPVPNQSMAVAGPGGRGAGLSPRPGVPGPTFAQAGTTVLQRPGYPMYPVYPGRVPPQFGMVVPLANARMAPHVRPNCLSPSA
jgi:hypothetical protein